jgi:flagellar export protein FliJ
MTRQHKTVSKVVKFKGITRGQLEQDVKKCRDDFNFEKEKLDCLEKEFREHLEKFNSRQDQGSVGVDLFYAYFEHLGRQIEQQKKCVLVRQGELDEKKKAVLEAYKEQRLMEILKDKILHEEIRATVQGEQKETDYQFLARKAER